MRPTGGLCRGRWALGPVGPIASSIAVGLGDAAAAAARALDGAVNLVTEQGEEAGHASPLAVTNVAQRVLPRGRGRCRGCRGSLLSRLVGSPDGRRCLPALSWDDDLRRELVPESLLGNAAAKVGLAEAVDVEDGLAEAGESLGNANPGAGFFRGGEKR